MKLTKLFFHIPAVFFLNISLFAQNEVRPEAVITEKSTGFQIRFSYAANISKLPINGRILIGFQKDLKKSVSPDTQPSFAVNFNDWMPGEKLIMDCANAVKQKVDLNMLDGWYAVQAIMVTSHDARILTNAIFKPGEIVVTNKNIVYIEKGHMCMPLDMLFILTPDPPVFKETETVKKVSIRSNLLTNFYGENDSLLATVILPPSYKLNKDRVYPTVYVFGGWGSSIYSGLASQQKRYGMSGFGNEKIFVFVNHECRSGYHNFCSSETNGPREETFFNELLPYIEKEYRVNKDPHTRFLMGQSSGAWAALWLLVNYPDCFGGAFAGSPDPVDFTEFIGTNIYEKGANMYYGKDGVEKHFTNLKQNSSDPLDNGLAIRDMVDMDRLAGWGEQMYSFDATFSKKGPGGEPFHLFNWETGEVDHEVAVSWEKFDLGKRISQLDKKQKASLKSKIHIYVNDHDLFGLNKSVESFSIRQAKEGIDADIRILHAAGHDVWTDDLRKLIHEDIDKITGLGNTFLPAK